MIGKIVIIVHVAKNLDLSLQNFCKFNLFHFNLFLETSLKLFVYMDYDVYHFLNNIYINLQMT